MYECEKVYVRKREIEKNAFKIRTTRLSVKFSFEENLTGWPDVSRTYMYILYIYIHKYTYIPIQNTYVYKFTYFRALYTFREVSTIDLTTTRRFKYDRSRGIARRYVHR